MYCIYTSNSYYNLKSEYAVAKSSLDNGTPRKHKDGDCSRSGNASQIWNTRNEKNFNGNNGDLHKAIYKASFD
ncbi:hypothetical protein ACH5RR_003703 [Cinchona calisaya]|uniref:Uncharacterized protein n=1 Tax=Cinchona calisaya TaxID=153742 RepID=A0ABD3AW98_9GENT